MCANGGQVAGSFLADAPPAQRPPDHLPAGRRRCRTESASDSNIAITNEALYVKVHRPILGPPRPQVIPISRHQRQATGSLPVT